MSASTILDACPIAVVAVRNDLSLCYANSAAESLFDCAELSLNLLELLPGLRELDRAAFGSPDGTWLLHAASRDRLQVTARRNDRDFLVEIDVKSIRLGDEDVTVVTIQDMTSLNSSMENILRAHRELEEFNRVAIGRELRMVALKEEVNELLLELGRDRRYVDDE